MLFGVIITFLSSCQATCDPPTTTGKVTFVAQLQGVTILNTCPGNPNLILTQFASGGQNAFASRKSNTGQWLVEISLIGQCGSSRAVWNKTFGKADFVAKTVNGNIAFEVANCQLGTYAVAIKISQPCSQVGCAACDGKKDRPQFQGNGTVENASNGSTFSIQVPEQPTFVDCKSCL